MARKYDHIRKKVIQLRKEKHLTLDQLVEQFGLPRTTIYYWIKDIEIPRTEAQKRRPKEAIEASKKKWADLREASYQEGLEEAPELLKDPLFRDFVVAYMCEGYKRSRNEVSFVNSDTIMVKLAHKYIVRFSKNKVAYDMQYHADHDPEELKAYWSKQLGISPEQIRIQRKSNSNQMSGRQWRSVHGLLTIRTGDTYFRARLQAWIDTVKKEWYTAL